MPGIVHGDVSEIIRHNIRFFGLILNMKMAEKGARVRTRRETGLRVDET